MGWWGVFGERGTQNTSVEKHSVLEFGSVKGAVTHEAVDLELLDVRRMSHLPNAGLAVAQMMARGAWVRYVTWCWSRATTTSSS